MLQAKINAYISFLEEKQYKDIYQDMSIMYGIIEIHFLHCLTKNAEKFLHSVNNQLNELGIKIQYSVLQGENNEYKIRIKNTGLSRCFACFHSALRVRR